MNKKDIIDHCIRYLFQQRMHKVKQDFDSLSIGTPLYGNIIVFNGITQVYNTFSNEYPEIITDIPDNLVNPLKRIHAVVQESREIQGVLRWLSNAVDTDKEFAYLICNGTPCATALPVMEEFEPLLTKYADKLELICIADVKKTMTI